MAAFNPLRIEEPGASDNPLYAGTPSEGAAVVQSVDRLGQWLSEQRAKSEKMGLWANGRPTAAGWLNAAKQYSENLLLGTSAPKGIRAYHGSPHSFERFDMSRIGTGEGAQAYGHGLYFAENEGVARGYRDYLSQPEAPFIAMDEVLRKFGGWRPNAADVREALTGHEATTHLAADPKVIDAIVRLAPDYNPKGAVTGDALRHYRTINEAIEATTNKGSMYEVNIKADPSHFLDWDKPLNQQSERVRGNIAGRTDWTTPDMTGARLYGELMKRANGDQAVAAQQLHEMGIPGIRYFDAGSRRTPTWEIGEGVTGADRNDLRAAMDYAIRNNIRGDTPLEIAAALRKTPQTGYAAIVRKYADQIDIKQPTRNTVVFDDSLIDILRKYGIAGLMLGGTAAAGARQQQ